MSEKFKESFEKKFWRLKMYRAWNISLLCIKQKQCIFEEINHPPMFQAPYDVHSRSRIIASWLHALIRPNVAVAVGRNLFRLWSQRKIVDIKIYIYIYFNLLYKQARCTRAGIDNKLRADKLSDLGQQAGHLLVIFENLEETSRIIMSETGNNWEKLNRLLAIWAVLRTIGIVRQVVGMHRKGIWGLA